MTLFDAEAEGHDRPETDRASMGAVYTPAALARWTASLLRDVSANSIRKVLDPACGGGALLDAVRRELSPLTSLVGFDLSAAAVESASTNLASGSADLYHRDALRTMDVNVPGVDAVIMNPPWGGDMSALAPHLRELGFTLAAGQFDSWDLFVEWTVRALPAGTVVAAILPDSVFLPEHSATRRLLLDRTQLNVVARLGEGWFESVFRGVTVLVYTTGTSTLDSVRSIRIDHAARRRITRGHTTLHHEAALASHTVNPEPWTRDPYAAFHATTSALDSPWSVALEARGGPWTNWFHVGRGVEMGARGELFQCSRCGWHRGPSRDIAVCKGCGDPTAWTLVQAITSEPVQDTVPLIVGRDVRRYAVQPSRWLRTGLTGISYKDPELYRRPKLLVRKTGLGLNAAVDLSGSHTNQVVFHYVPRAGTPQWVMHYVEGVLCSKVLLALHLSRTGETEWRSHPYVTPKVLAMLPVPVPTDLAALGQARSISTAVAALREMPTVERAGHERHVDELVAGLYGLEGAGCEWVEQALAQTQALDAFAHLRATSLLKAVVA